LRTIEAENPEQTVSTQNLLVLIKNSVIMFKKKRNHFSGNDTSLVKRVRSADEAKCNSRNNNTDKSKAKRIRKARTAFTDDQLLHLEKSFNRKR